MHARIACVLLLSKVKKTMKEGAEREREMVDCEILVQGSRNGKLATIGV
jgi:hypothetical protein